MYILLRSRYSLFFFSLTNTIALYKTRIYKMIDLYSINRFPLFLPIFIIFLFFLMFWFHPFFFICFVSFKCRDACARVDGAHR